MAKKEENEELRSVLELTSPEARKYFMEPKNYCTLDLPDYVDFKPVLGFVEAIVGDTAFGTLLKNDAVKPRDFEEVNHKLLITIQASLMALILASVQASLTLLSFFHGFSVPVKQDAPQHSSS